MASTEVIEFVAMLADRGVWFSVRGANQDKLWVHPRALYRELSRDEHDFIRDHRAELVDLACAVQRHRQDIEAGDPTPAPSPPQTLTSPDPRGAVSRPRPRTPEPEPEVYVFGHRITDLDVREAMRMQGDEMLEDYMSGRLPKAMAYRMAGRGIRQSIEIRRARPVSSDGWR